MTLTYFNLCPGGGIYENMKVKLKKDNNKNRFDSFLCWLAILVSCLIYIFLMMVFLCESDIEKPNQGKIDECAEIKPISFFPLTFTTQLKSDDFCFGGEDYVDVCCIIDVQCEFLSKEIKNSISVDQGETIDEFSALKETNKYRRVCYDTRYYHLLNDGFRLSGFRFNIRLEIERINQSLV